MLIWCRSGLKVSGSEVESLVGLSAKAACSKLRCAEPSKVIILTGALSMVSTWQYFACLEGYLRDSDLCRWLGLVECSTCCFETKRELALL